MICLLTLLWIPGLELDWVEGTSLTKFSGALLDTEVDTAGVNDLTMVSLMTSRAVLGWWPMRMTRLEEICCWTGVTDSSDRPGKVKVVWGHGVEEEALEGESEGRSSLESSSGIKV